MTPATTPLTLEEYLAVDGEEWIRLGLPEGRCEYQDGALQELPPESDLNDRIALNLRDYLIEQVSNEWLIRIHSCEIAVPKIRSQDPATRFPDLVILEEEHLPIIERRLAIPLNTGVDQDSDRNGPFDDFRPFPIPENRILSLRSQFFRANWVITEMLLTQAFQTIWPISVRILVNPQTEVSHRLFCLRVRLLG